MAAAQNDSRENRWIRVAVIGDAKCGKTNLVVRLAQNVYAGTKSRQAETGLADPLPPIKFEGPPQEEQSPEHFREVVKLTIHDTAAGNAIWEQTDGLLYNCDVIVVAFDARSREEEAKNLARAETGILARLKNTPIVCDKPVVLVGTKTDCRKDDTDASAASSAQAQQLVEKYPSIETFIHCSARTGLRVADIFWYARRLCLFPNGPLVSKKHKELTAGCKFALRRVFRMCQKERAATDTCDALTGDEIKAFQVMVFGQPLSDKDLAAVKQMVKDYAKKKGQPNAFDDETDHMTLDGFYLMQEVFLQRGRTELVWQMLRKYGFDDKLSLEPGSYHSTVECKPEEETQLSEYGRETLKRWFALHDIDCDGALDKAELLSFFGPLGISPNQPHPFAQNTDYTKTPVLLPVRSSPKGALSLSGFLARWEFAVSTAPAEAMGWLATLGTNAPSRFLMRVKRRRRDKRTLLRCLLLDRDTRGAEHTDSTKAGEMLFSKLECGLIAACDNKKKGPKPERRIGVVAVPTDADVAGGATRPKADDDDDDGAADDLDSRGPFLTVVRHSDAASEAMHIENSKFYDVVSVVVNGLSKKEAQERIEAVQAAVGDIPVLPFTMGKVSAKRAGDGGGDPDDDYTSASDSGGRSRQAIPVLAYTAECDGARTWVADAWGNAEARRGGGGSWLGSMIVLGAVGVAMGAGLTLLGFGQGPVALPKKEVVADVAAATTAVAAAVSS